MSEASREEAVQALDDQPRSLPGIATVLLTSLYGQLGAVDQGYELMELRSDPASQAVVYMVTHPIFEPYRDDPRFQAFQQVFPFR